MTFLGSQISPSWGYQQSKSYEMSFYFIYGETAHELRKQPVPSDGSWRWLTPSEALQAWQHSEIWISPFTVQKLNGLVHSHGNPEKLKLLTHASAPRKKVSSSRSSKDQSNLLCSWDSNSSVFWLQPSSTDCTDSVGDSCAFLVHQPRRDQLRNITRSGNRRSRSRSSCTREDIVRRYGCSL